VLRAHGLDDEAVRATLAATVPDSLGESRALYPPHEVAAAISEPKPIRPLVDEIVADLLVSAGRHPTAALQLAQSSGQPASVISLVEERLRRMGIEQQGAIRDPGIRGLALIDEWTVRPETQVDRPVPEAASAPEPPDPPAA
jgi:hypothetical protein